MGGLVDVDTIVLLFSMMVINTNLRLAGFFGWVGNALLRLTRSPRGLLAVEIAAVGLLSALFLNDTICLMFTPLVVELMAHAGCKPVPYLIALATAVCERGLFGVPPDVEVLRLDTPAGLVEARPLRRGARVESVSFLNVPSFVYALGHVADVPGVGPVPRDVAFGGGLHRLHPHGCDADRSDARGPHAGVRHRGAALG